LPALYIGYTQLARSMELDADIARNLGELLVTPDKAKRTARAMKEPLETLAELYQRLVALAAETAPVLALKRDTDAD
jgi:archaellum component FlaC